MTTRERNLKLYPRGLKDLPFTERLCSQCRKIKDVSEFYFAPSASVAISSKCKECIRIYHRNKVKRCYKRIPNHTLVQCVDCKKIRLAKMYYRDKYRKHGISNHCKYCHIERLRIKLNSRLKS